MLARMFDRRCEGYEAAGYSLLLPGGAVPGWPAEVPLPIEPGVELKKYAPSIRRLVWDGVESAAGGPVHACCPSTETRGTWRGTGLRSATEAFSCSGPLQRSEATAGHFQLNIKMPIPFNTKGKMEVDFLCESARLVIELDGAQHLADPGGPPPGPREDVALQEQGYFVLASWRGRGEAPG